MSGAYASTIQSAASAYGVPAAVLDWQINQESGYNPNAVNPTSGATGIAQFLPSTAANAGFGIAPFNPSDPTASINAAAAYDAALYQQTGSWSGALKSYGTLYNAPTSVLTSFQNMLDANNITDANPATGGAPVPFGAAVPSAPGTAAPLWGGGASVPAALAGQSGGWMAWAGELGLRVALSLVGMVLVAGGFYLAGRTGLGVGDFNPDKLARAVGKAAR